MSPAEFAATPNGATDDEAAQIAIKLGEYVERFSKVGSADMNWVETITGWCEQATGTTPDKLTVDQATEFFNRLEKTIASMEKGEEAKAGA